MANLWFACHCPSDTSTWVDPNVFCDRGFGLQGIDRKLDLEANESHKESSHAATDITHNPEFYFGSTCRWWNRVCPRWITPALEETNSFAQSSCSAQSSLRLNPNNSALSLVFLPAVRLCLQKSVICSPHGVSLRPAGRVTICRCSRWYGCVTVSALQTVSNVKAITAQHVDRECSVSLRGDVKETCYRVYSLRERSTAACSIYLHAVMLNHNITSHFTFCTGLNIKHSNTVCGFKNSKTVQLKNLNIFIYSTLCF